jgi:hypothetical protein
MRRSKGQSRGQECAGGEDVGPNCFLCLGVSQVHSCTSVFTSLPLSLFPLLAFHNGRLLRSILFAYPLQILASFFQVRLLRVYCACSPAIASCARETESVKTDDDDGFS